MAPANPPRPAPADDGPRAVSRFEANLLRVLRFFLKQLPADQALHILESKPARPNCLSRPAVELVQDSLAKGTVLYLARHGGWRRERFLRAGKPVEGRLWERSKVAELELKFTGHSLEFLLWVVTGKLSDAKPAWNPPASDLTPADLFLVFLAYDSLRDTDKGGNLRAHPLLGSHALCRLAFPRDFATLDQGPNFAPWLTGPGAAMLEALQPVLRSHLLAVERGKGQIGDWAQMRLLGQSQERVLGQFLQLADEAGRPDLARFVLDAAAELLVGDLTPAYWLGGLQGGGPPRLGERLEVHRASLAFLRQVDRLQRWERRARTSGYLDEDYAVSQLWKSDWERVGGDDVAARAQALLRQIEPLKVQQ